MSTTLVIDALRAIDDAPNGLDRSILLQMQENIACDVMKIYRDDLARLLAKQKAQGVSPAAAAEERKDFFAQRLNTEYRNRAGANVFSLPMYLETAENRYRLEIRRHLQQVQDYIAHGKHVAETHYTGSVREMRAVDPGMSDMAAKVAAGLNGINGVLEKLSRIGKDAATKMATELQRALGDGLRGIEKDPFASAVLSDAQTLAAAQRELERMESADSKIAFKH
jgi:hypothetical protein